MLSPPRGRSRQPQVLQSSTTAQQMLVTGDPSQGIGLVWFTPHRAQGGLWGHRAKQGSSGAAWRAKLSWMAEQDWQPLPQPRRARRQRTQHFLHARS